MYIYSALRITLPSLLAGALFLACSAPPAANSPGPVGAAGTGGAHAHGHAGGQTGAAGAPGEPIDEPGGAVDGGTASGSDGGPPPPPDDLRPAPIEDLNPDPHILEVKMEARVTALSIHPGTTTELFTYNGVLPGPMLRLRAGDRLIVHFTNRLPEPTTIHWHGLRIPPEMDGVPDHPHPAVPPGKTFRYEFIVPDAGLYWYHPHQNSAVQLGWGLYGTILVDEPEEPANLGEQTVLVLSDLEIDKEGKLNPTNAGGNIATLFGREGQTVLVNGRVKPTLGARVGKRQRLRVLNAAKSRYFQLVADGQKFLRIGGDGGRMAEPVEVERPVLTPGERADLIWEPKGQPGTAVPLRWVPYDRGYGSVFMRPDVEILTLALSLDAPTTSPPLPPLRRTIQPLALANATPVAIRLTRNDVDKKFYLGVNGKPFGGDDHIRARLGETQIWDVVNELDWAHPFHLHGFFFQVLDENGAPRLPLEWKDTADVPTKGKLKLAVKFDERPGMWMFHCHILDHADAGMMGMVMLDK